MRPLLLPMLLVLPVVSVCGQAGSKPTRPQVVPLAPLVGSQVRAAFDGALTDLDGDGDLDLVLSAEQVESVPGSGGRGLRLLGRAQAWWGLLNDGDGGVEAVRSLGLAGAPFHGGVPDGVSAWADWDGDGDGDAAALHDGRLVLLRTGPGPSLTRVALPGALPTVGACLDLRWLHRPQGLELRAVFVAADRGVFSWCVLSEWTAAGPGQLRSGRATGLPRPLSGGAFRRAVAWSDLDGGGSLALCLAPGAGDFGGMGAVSVLESDGAGRLVARNAARGVLGHDAPQAAGVVALGLGGAPSERALVLLGHDGWSYPEAPAEVLLRPRGDGMLCPVADWLWPEAPGHDNGSCQVGDLDGDGRLDLLVQGDVDWGSYVALGGDDGRFRAVPLDLGPDGQGGRRAALGDLDGDGDLDAWLATPGGPGLLVFDPAP